MWPSECSCVCVLVVDFMSVWYRINCLTWNNAVVVANVLVAVHRDTHASWIPVPIYPRGVFIDPPDPKDHFLLPSKDMSFHSLLPDLLSPWQYSSFHLTWPFGFCKVAYLTVDKKIKKHMLELPWPSGLSLWMTHWLITPKCSQQPAGLFVVIASVWRSAKKVIARCLILAPCD